MFDDTITAIATPPGRGAIGIVRVSGGKSLEIFDKIFSTRHGKRLKDRASHSLVYGKIKDGDFSVDEVMLGIMRAPNSYTGEDVVEVYCHGGPVVLECILDLSVRLGCRLAEPGEFTRRAFLNGKIDLTQAEAIADIINAPTDRSRQAAVNQLEGSLKNRLASLHEELLLLISGMEASIEFPEDVEDFTEVVAAPGERGEESSFVKKLNSLENNINQLLENADAGRILHDGYRVAIAGKPNSGKSSLLNLLAKEERALVTDIPGTTRDTLEVDVNIEKFPVRFIDTAGLRAARGKIEKQGIEKAEKTIKESDLVLWIADRSRRPATGTSGANLSEIDCLPKHNNIILVLNKCDLKSLWPEKTVAKFSEKHQVVELCALTGEGIKDLHNSISKKLIKMLPAVEDQVVILRVRHKDLLTRAARAIKNAKKMLRKNPLPELIVVDIQEALNAVGELTGKVTTEDLLDKIFGDFCIGK